MKEETTIKCSKCQRTSAVVDLVSGCPFCDKPMTYTERRLELVDVICNCRKGSMDDKQYKATVENSIAQAEQGMLKSVVNYIKANARQNDREFSYSVDYEFIEALSSLSPKSSEKAEEINPKEQI